MEAPVHDPRDEAIADLVTRLIEDARDYARAEADLMKQIARHRAAKARTGAILLGAGAVLLLSSLTALILGAVLGLATLIGPLAAGLAVAAILAGSGYFLVMKGLKGLKALSGDEEEKQAIRHGETHAEMLP